MNNAAIGLLSLWYFLLISDDLMLLLCSFAIWRRNRIKRIRLFQLLAPMLIGVVGYSLEREVATYAVGPEFRRAIFAATLSSPGYLIATIIVRTFRSFFAWRFVLYSLGITNGNH